MLLFLEFIFCLTVISFSGYYLSRYGDVIADKTGISSSWVGLILIATATSLPELATGIASVTVAGVPNIALGDVLGSTVFNLTILVILDALYQRETLYSTAAQGHILSAAFGILMIAFTGFSLLLDQSGMSPTLGHIGIYTPLMIFIYLVAVRAIHHYEQRMLDTYVEVSTDRYPQVTLHRAIIGYSSAAVAVIAVGIWLPFVAAEIAKAMGWGNSFVGTLLVATATSAPEVAVTISALRIGAIDMAIASLLGSNLFDILVIAIDDLFYSQGAILARVDASHAVTAFTAVMMSILVIIGFVLRPKQRAILKLTWISLCLLLLYILNHWILYQHG